MIGLVYVATDQVQLSFQLTKFCKSYATVTLKFTWAGRVQQYSQSASFTWYASDKVSDINKAYLSIGLVRLASNRGISTSVIET